MHQRGGKVKRIALILPLLAGCSVLEHPPVHLTDIHQAAIERITYQHYYKSDLRYIPKDQKGTGNCSVFAFTVWVDAVKDGHTDSKIIYCHTWRGEPHAFTKVDEWALDVRFNTPIKITEQDCK